MQVEEMTLKGVSEGAQLIYHGSASKGVPVGKGGKIGRKKRLPCAFPKMNNVVRD